MHIVSGVMGVASFAVFLAGAGAALAQPGMVISGAAAMPGLPYGPVAPYAYGMYAPWGPCPSGRCADSASVRRYIAREIRLQELRNAPGVPVGGGFTPPGESPYGAPRYLPPPTPESELQPSYRGSGDVRPEYRDAGEAIAKPWNPAGSR